MSNNKQHKISLTTSIKRIRKNMFFLVAFLGFQTFYAQVGIGTTSPTEQLEVVGDVILDTIVKVGNLPKVLSTDKNFHLLTRNSNAFPTTDPVGLVKILKPNNIAVPPIRMQKYLIYGMPDDKVELDLGLDKDKYIVSVGSFEQNAGNSLEHVLVYDENPVSTGTKTIKLVGPFNIHITENATNLVLNIDNRGTSEKTYDNVLIVYDVTLYIYLREYFHPVDIEIDMVTSQYGSFPDSGQPGALPDIFYRGYTGN